MDYSLKVLDDFTVVTPEKASRYQAQTGWSGVPGKRPSVPLLLGPFKYDVQQSSIIYLVKILHGPRSHWLAGAIAPILFKCSYRKDYKCGVFSFSHLTNKNDNNSLTNLMSFALTP